MDPPARSIVCFGDNTTNQLLVPAGGSIITWYTVAAGETYNCECQAGLAAAAHTACAGWASVPCASPAAHLALPLPNAGGVTNGGAMSCWGALSLGATAPPTTGYNVRGEEWRWRGGECLAVAAMLQWLAVAGTLLHTCLTPPPPCFCRAVGPGRHRPRLCLRH